MRNNKVSKGTPQHFEEQVLRRIQELGGDVEACDSIMSSEDGQMYYVDDTGVLGTPGDIYTYEELEDIFYDGWDDDPVISQYDTFDSWFKDTTRFMNVTRHPESTFASRVERGFKDKGIECSVTKQDTGYTVLIGTTEYDVPFDDLEGESDEDVDYIVGEIADMEDESDV